MIKTEKKIQHLTLIEHVQAAVVLSEIEHQLNQLVDIVDGKTPVKFLDQALDLKNRKLHRLRVAMEDELYEHHRGKLKGTSGEDIYFPTPRDLRQVGKQNHRRIVHRKGQADATPAREDRRP